MYVILNLVFIIHGPFLQVIIIIFLFFNKIMGPTEHVRLILITKIFKSIYFISNTMNLLYPSLVFDVK